MSGEWPRAHASGMSSPRSPAYAEMMSAQVEKEDGGSQHAAPTAGDSVGIVPKQPGRAAAAAVASVQKLVEFAQLIHSSLCVSLAEELAFVGKTSSQYYFSQHKQAHVD